MRQSRKPWSFGLSSVGVVILLAAATAVSVPRLKEWLSRDRSPLEDVITTPVRRTDLNVTLTTGGKVESTKRTSIECELMRLDLSVKGQGMSGGGSSTVLSVIPDGSTVKKGDILCVIDSSDYEEMLRQQRMTVERSKADHRQAELDLEVAQMSVREFKDGTLLEALQELSGLIALGETTWERASDRLKWARRMLEKGYVPIGQISTEELNERRAAYQLKRSKSELEVFKRFSAPRVTLTLEGQVRSAEAMLNYQDQRLRRHLDREEMLQQQVEFCTIRAPHDGFVIYANDDQKQLQIQEGMVVRQHQNLFYLPDLTQMEAMAMVHESVASRVRPGMRAKVRIEALPGQILEGHVTSVAQLPTQNMFNEVRYFYTEVALDTLPKGLKPGMSAELEISTERRLDVLAIPLEALAFEAGREICYVADHEGIQRREIKVGQATRGLLEVTEGLDEGENVVINPVRPESDLEQLSPFNREDHSWNRDSLSD